MKNMVVIFVLFVSPLIFTSQAEIFEGKQKSFKSKVRFEKTPEEKEAYQNQQHRLKVFHERKNQLLPKRVLVQQDEKKIEDIEAALYDKGFKTGFSQEEEQEYQEQQLLSQREKDKQKQKLLQKEKENKELLQGEGFNFIEDQNNPTLDPSNVETWTPENINSVNPEFFKKLKTVDLKKLIQNKELVSKLSIDQVRAIDEKELSEIIQRNVKNLFSSKNHQAIVFPDEFVEKLSGDQINQLLTDHVGGFNGMGKNFSSYFSPKMRKNLDQRQAEYKNYGGKVADLMQEARLQVTNIKEKVENLQLPLQDRVRILKIIDPESYQIPKISIDESKNVQDRNPYFLSTLEKLTPEKVVLMNVDQIKEFLTIKESSFKNRKSYDYVQSFDPENFADAISSSIAGISDIEFIKERRLPKEIIDRLTFDQVAVIMQKTGGEYSKINSKIISSADFYKITSKYFKGDLLKRYLKLAKTYGRAVAKAMIKNDKLYKTVLSNDQTNDQKR